MSTQTERARLGSAIRMVVNMLERDNTPVRTEAAGALLAAFGELSAAPASQNDPVKCELRLHAYYYAFDQTGVPEIDRVLSAVACAGKSYHCTDSWNDPAELPYGHRGATPIEWIQNAANDAAKRPVAQQEQDKDALLQAAAHALRSYQYGNSSSDLAESVADKIDAAIGSKQP